jgi:hypothetical protein
VRGVKIGYSDFVKLCRVDNPEDWCSWLLVKGDGVYVKVPPGDVLMTSEERAGLSEHPTGNLAELALRFPCTLNELQAFLEDQGVYGCIDAFDMADWVVASATKERLANIAEKPLGTRAETTYQNIIAALLDCIAGKVPNVGKHPSFKDETQLIKIIDEHYDGIDGLSESNLSRKFPAAKRSLDRNR